jgi:hypothetical protein|tara:strand:+ start:113 stop:1396 length:1284 start_codon:yes stop_codon:yes gene_type:complete
MSSPFALKSVLEVADCDEDYDGPLEDIEWSLCTLMCLKSHVATIRMVSDNAMLHGIPLCFLRLPQKNARKRKEPSSYSEELPLDRTPRAPSLAASPVRAPPAERQQTPPKQQQFSELFGPRTTHVRRPPQACGFGSEQGTADGFHDPEGNFYRPGDTVWVMVNEAADVSPSCRVGKARDGAVYYCPAHIASISVLSDDGSSRINQTIVLMAYVNDTLIEAYNIDPSRLRGPRVADAWYLLPAWCFEVTASSIAGFAIARRAADDTSHPESFVFAGVLNTDDELVAEGFSRLETGTTQAELFDRAIPLRFARQLRQPRVPAYSALDAKQIFPPAARDALGLHPKVGILHVGSEQDKGAIAYIASINGAAHIVTVRHGFEPYFLHDPDPKPNPDPAGGGRRPDQWPARPLPASLKRGDRGGSRGARAAA